MFDDVYRLSDQLVLVPSTMITDAESQLNISFPHGYRAFLTTLGIGTYCDLVNVYPPAWIPRRTSEVHQYLSHHYEDFWDAGQHVLSKADALTSLVIASTVDGDEIVFCSHIPYRLFVLPRHDNTIYWMDDGFADPIRWMSGGGLVDHPPPFRYFEPWSDRLTLELFTTHQTFELSQIAEFCIKRWNYAEIRQIREAENVHFLFLRAIGGRVQLTWAWPDDRRIGIRIDYDAAKADEVDRFADELTHMGFYATGRYPHQKIVL